MDRLISGRYPESARPIALDLVRQRFELPRDVDRLVLEIDSVPCEPTSLGRAEGLQERGHPPSGVIGVERGGEDSQRIIQRDCVTLRLANIRGGDRKSVV